MSEGCSQISLQGILLRFGCGIEALKRGRRLKIEKLLDAGRDEIADMSKSGQAFFFAPLHTTGIGEAPMNLPTRIGKVRARAPAPEDGAN